MKSVIVTFVFLLAASGGFFLLAKLFGHMKSYPRASMFILGAFVVGLVVALHFIDIAMGGRGISSMLGVDRSLIDRR